MRVFLALAAALAVAGCQSPGTQSLATTSVARPEARPFDPSISDTAYAQALDGTIAQLGRGDDDVRKALVVFGANWCHDSRALAGWLLDPSHASRLTGFRIVFIDVGRPQDNQGRNLELVARFGIPALKSTPALVVVGETGHRENPIEDAIAWRDAASRSEVAIAAAINRYAGAPGG